MGYTKRVKSSQYFKRYQTKFRRRRECKTDYYARKRMVLQDVNKLGCNKYRLVARFTNKKVITQIVFSTLEGDKVLCSADSSELKQYGLTTGLTNYASAYCTGLLLSRRLLKQINLDGVYKGVATVDGKDYDVSALAETYNNEKKPFKAILDIGLTRSTVGNRVYAVLKGACDGGIHIPHNTRNFFGATCDKDETKRTFKYNAETHRNRIFGCHVDEYIEHMEKENAQKAKAHFSLWNACLKKAGVEDVESLYKKVHEGIRKNPSRVEKKKRTVTPQTFEDEARTVIKTKNGSYKRDRKLTLAERKDRIQKKIATFRSLE